MNDATKTLYLEISELAEFVEGCYSVAIPEYEYAFEAIKHRLEGFMQKFYPESKGIMEIKLNVE